MITGSILVVVLVIVLTFWFVIWYIFGGNAYFNIVPKPEITYGEFPFTLKYELDGEIKVLEDTIICEFDGFKVIGEAGKFRQWKTKIKSGGEKIILWDTQQLDIRDDFGRKILEFYFSYGNGEYYMGDEYNSSNGEINSWIDYTYKNDDGTTGGSAYKSDVACEKYKIRLISWEVSPPITNSFK